MKDNLFIKIISSVPIILITLYFIPFLGICLLIFRNFIYTNRKKKMLASVMCLVVGLLILIPKGLDSLFQILKLDVSEISFFNNIITSNWYLNGLIKYSKLLISVGIIFIILTFVFARIEEKIKRLINSYINKELKQEQEIEEKNNLIMKEKQEKAKNTHVIYCPYCGADNLLTGAYGTCKFCRRDISIKKN